MAVQPGISEYDIILRCKKGDLKYQELLYKRFYGYAMGIGLRYLPDRDDVQETVNDAFIKAFNAIGGYDPALPFKAWFRKIVVNTALDRRRKNLRQVELTPLEDAFHVSDTAATIGDLEVQDILNLLQSLPEIQRVIFNLFEIDGYAHDEIAALLNIQPGASRVYLGRAKEKMKTAILKQPIQ